MCKELRYTGRSEAKKKIILECGICNECREEKAQKWEKRLIEEVRINPNGKAVKLNIKKENIKILSKEIEGKIGYELENSIVKIAIRRYLERWRKKYKTSVKHWFITEVKETEKAELEIKGIIFTDESMKEIKAKWGYGTVEIKEKANKTEIKRLTETFKIIKTGHEKYINKVLCSDQIGGDNEELKKKRENTKKWRDKIELEKKFESKLQVKQEVKSINKKIEGRVKRRVKRKPKTEIFE